MTDTTLSPHLGAGAAAKFAFDGAARLWFGVTAAGLWIFVLYIAVYYLGAAVTGGLPGWAAAALPTGAPVYVPGDTKGNIAMAAHLGVATIIMGGGVLQLTPWVRQKFPAFHRWNGRVYMVLSALTSVAGFYMVWIRGTSSGDLLGHIAITIDGILIITFVWLAWATALRRDFQAHRRWALRLFMVVNAVWFLRIGYRAWLFIFDGPTPYFGTFFMFWQFGQYLLPLAILELYFMAERRRTPMAYFSMAGALAVVSMLMAIGIYAAATNMWLPRM